MEPSPRRAAEARSQPVPPVSVRATVVPPPPMRTASAAPGTVPARQIDGVANSHRRTRATTGRAIPLDATSAGGRAVGKAGTAEPSLSKLDERAMPPGVPATWQVPDVALPRLLADAVKDFPEALALAERGGTHLTHVELAGLVDRLAMALRERGVGRIVLVDAGPIATTIVAHAAWRLGIPVVVGLDAGPSGAAAEVAPQEAGTPSGERDGATDADDAPDDAPDEAADEAADGAVDETVDGAAGDAPADGIMARLPDWDPDRDLAVGTRRHLGDLDVPAAAMLVDDLGRLGATGDGRAAGLARAVHRGRRLLRRVGHRDRSSLASTLEHTTQGVLPPVAPDAVALVHVTPTARHVFTHRTLVAAVFQVRLWIPDMAAGTERVAVAMPLDTPVAFVVGPLLAVLAGATLRCDRDPATTIAGATIAFGSVAAWHDVARRSRRRHRRPLARSDGTPSSLRIGGVVTSGADDMLPAAEVRAVVSHTEGARLRHFWVAPAAAGPVAAQPVYGRVLGTPGAEALTDTHVGIIGGATVATGPQFADQHSPAPAAPSAARAPRRWHDVHGHVPAPSSAAPRKDAP